MSLGQRLSRLLGRQPRLRVRVLLRGRIGEGWLDIDRTLTLAVGSTLGDLLDVAERKAVPLRAALDNSPHLRETLMLNGERCRVEDNLQRPLNDGDEVYLLAPVAGGSRGGIASGFGEWEQENW